MLEDLKQKVYEANMLLPKYGLVTFTWGNVSAIDTESGLFVIKPSGVDYEKMTPADMVVMDLQGNKVEGDLRPSSDTPTHLELYKAFPEIGGIVHTHSSYATSWAQAGRSIPCYGTTHADYIYGEVPCLRCLTKEEIDEAYEENTGHLIVNEFQRMNKEIMAVPAVLCKNHGPFAFGKDAMDAVHNAVVLEEVAKMAYRTETINPKVAPAPQELQDKHYYRKHGANAYYGQN
ncbi:L-ribulose-5-phosphate 4-epimerase [Suilimivivens aceti]|uniref:L-ribulose-5-phosphate 4-epimerase n=1 Tax=Suilimivivens aceti TaxID=2981774 RepID=A0ABT2T5N5_9FIRM|nr:L-ribulose-5-phosphate 4-epimerase [Suilimivivens aceti]MCU6745296.1 L-ribulose-5-phosphate 4-epimerase [Suilimivivens aceti]SCI14156.1 L-ribulose-5-phosphate 4-epimerase UlaF [uncultured Clostridium sp.]